VNLKTSTPHQLFYPQMQHTCPVQYDHISHKPQWSVIDEYGSLKEWWYAWGSLNIFWNST